MLKTRPIRDKGQTIESIPFVLKHVLFAMRPVWRGSVRIDVSGLVKTSIDILDDPAIGGGIRHVADCLAAYFDREDASQGDALAPLGADVLVGGAW